MATRPWPARFEHQQRMVVGTDHHGLALRPLDIDAAEPAAPMRRLIAGAVEAAGDGVLAARFRKTRIEGLLDHLGRSAAAGSTGCKRRQGDRLLACMFRTGGDQQRAAIFHILGDVIVIEDRQHAAMPDSGRR